MRLIWRLASPAYAHVLDGEGARLAGGRWNSPGRRMVYASSHLSLSVLEVFVHIPPSLRDDLPELEAVRLSVPDDAAATTVHIGQFEKLMANSDPLAACRAVGDAWLQDGGALIMMTPSVIVPEEWNVMLNPSHEGMEEVRVERSRRFHFDPRLRNRGSAKGGRSRP